MSKVVVGFILFFLVLTSCNNSTNSNYMAMDQSNQVLDQNHPGKKLMETHCYVCHSPKGNHSDRIAPPMIAIKRHYISDNTSKEDFVQMMQDWIEDPNEDNAKMFGAVRRFGIMPKAAYPKETIAAIAEYMYDNEIEQPEWFEEHFNQRGKGRGNK